MFPLLVFSAWINYIDRGALSVAAPVLGPELGLDARGMGVLLSTFFWTYATLQPFAGHLVDRYPVKWVYAAGFAIWSVATILTGFTGGLTTLMLCRIALGMGESVAYPSYSKIIATRLPAHRHGFANAIIDAATKAGPAVGTWLTATGIGAFGWRVFFIGMGAVTLVWLLPWSRTQMPPAIEARAAAATPTVSIADLLARKQFWGTSLGLFFYNYVYYFLLTWLPSYLMNERGLSLQAMGVAGAIPWLATVVSALILGRLSDRWIREGAGVFRVRRLILICGLLLSAVALPAVNIPDRALAFAAMIVAFLGMGITTSNLWALSQALAGPQLAGRWTGLQNGFGNLGGVVAPIVTGYIVSNTHSFAAAFAAASGSLILSAICYAALARN